MPRRECKLVQPLWRSVWRFPKQLKMVQPNDPAVLCRGLYQGSLAQRCLRICVLHCHAEGLTKCNRQKHLVSNLPRAKGQRGRVGSRAASPLPGIQVSLMLSKITPVRISLRMVLGLWFAGMPFEGRNGAFVDLLLTEQGGKCWLRNKLMNEQTNKWTNKWMALQAAIRCTSKTSQGKF